MLVLIMFQYTSLWRKQCFFVFVLVGNKDDDPDRKVVLTQDAQRFAERMQIQLFETSAKDNKNVEEVGIYDFDTDLSIIHPHNVPH